MKWNLKYFAFSFLNFKLSNNLEHVLILNHFERNVKYLNGYLVVAFFQGCIFFRMKYWLPGEKEYDDFLRKT